jgi:fibrillarin-like pre-rRNA processing protein
VAASAWPNLRREGRELYTVNARPGRSVYGEARRSMEGVELRHWDPWRSKLAAYVLRDGAPLPLERARAALYLGAGHGTTVSHLSEMMPARPVFCVEKSPAPFAGLLALSRERSTLLPILADAHLPERYQAEVGVVELLYQDVAQRDQATIFLDNARACLAPRGTGVLMLKVRSVTQRKTAPEIVRETRRALGEAGFAVRSQVDLTPFAREHVALVVGG